VLFEAMYRKFGRTVPLQNTVITHTGSRISLRNDIPKDDDMLFIRVGQGDLTSIARSAVTSFSDYDGLETKAGKIEGGAFCISVYTPDEHIHDADIFAAMPRPKYRKARYGDVKDLLHQVLPTVIMEYNYSEELANIQVNHFDFVLRVPQFLCPKKPVWSMDRAEQRGVRNQIMGQVDSVMARFSNPIDTGY